MNVLSLFSGIGGIDLGLERAGMRTVAFCEREPAAQHWLREHWPGVPIFDDVCTLSGEPLRGTVDLIAGGFPCQPFSVAGKQQGTQDERHLWPHFARLIGEIRPRWVLAENVPGLRTIAADLVLEDLEKLGYTAWPFVVGADDVGAPHRRKRVWIVAHRESRRAISGDWRSERLRRGGDETADPSLSERREPCESNGAWHVRHIVDDRSNGSFAVAHRDGGGCALDRSRGVLDRQWETLGDDVDGRGKRAVGEPTGAGLEGQRADAGEPQEPESRHSGAWPARPGQPQHGWEAPRLAYTNAIGRGQNDGGELDSSGCCEAHRLAYTTNDRRNRRSRSGESGRDAGAGNGTELESNERRPPCRLWDEPPNGGTGRGGGMADASSEPSRGTGQPRQEPHPGSLESGMGDSTDGLPRWVAGYTPAHRREALKALGNAVVPQVVEVIGRGILMMDGGGFGEAAR